MRAPARSLRWGLLLAGSLLHATCGGLDDVPGRSDHCVDSSDCAQGSTCFEGTCLAAGSYAVRVLPPKQATGAPTDFFPLMPGAGDWTLLLDSLATIAGTLELLDGGPFLPQLESVATRKEATTYSVQAVGRSRTIRELPFTSTYSTSASAGGSYELQVPPGLWQVTVSPSDPSIPSSQAELSVPPLGKVDPRLLVFSTGLIKLEGTVQYGVGASWPEKLDEVPLFRLQAFDKERGLRLSQLSAPVAGGGSFALGALRTGLRLVLRFTPSGMADGSPLSESNPIPYREISYSAEGAAEERIELGGYGEALAISGRVLHDGAPVKDATVQLEGLVTGGGTLSVTCATDENGLFSTWVRPSLVAMGSASSTSYAVTIIPPQGSRAARAKFSMPITSAGSIGELNCASKVVIKGHVLDHRGAPLEHLAIKLLADAQSPLPGTSSGESETSSTGAFSFLVEPGGYRLQVRPSLSAALPWASIKVRASTEPIEEEIRVGRPLQIAGRAELAVDGALYPVNGAAIEVYRVVSASTSPVLVYEALSDTAGGFSVYLPMD